ncbi:hypothetical protein GCWU000342_02256 [Shuttleworthella satelles DSM 14600]|uniref:Uncharacterized protein n=1 Tax=Shuttleworthella satelles DSM 14600 TaxID=626523 RepID=C4GDT1_9FIRM|nr:hypothetical protein GCWU000342_02256 [Shuttleworthia satelles DSM 14600]
MITSCGSSGRRSPPTNSLVKTANRFPSICRHPLVIKLPSGLL